MEEIMSGNRRIPFAIRAMAILFSVVVLTLIPFGCTSMRGERGVTNKWRDTDLEPWEPGKTTEGDVTTILGPPSQIIDLGGETIFYYLREQTRSDGLVLIVWNQRNERTIYDRAIFFFDPDNILTKYSYSLEAIPYAE
jgi:hypothetical protein